MRAAGEDSSTAHVRTFEPGTVAHIYSPSYSGGRDQEDLSPRQIVHKTLSQKNPSPKRAGRVALGVNLEFKLHHYKKKKKRKCDN
jgi:hypothetical protein